MLTPRGLGLLAVLALCAPRAAYACSVEFHCPASRILPGEGGQLPANIHGILWRQPCTDDPTADLAVELSARAPGEQPRALEFTLEKAKLGPDLTWVRWQETLAPGTRLVLSYRLPASRGTRALGPESDAGPGPAPNTFELTVTKEAPIPQRPGTLVARTHLGSLSTLSIDGDCTHELVASYVDLQLDADAESQAWHDALYIETWVDDAKGTPFKRSLGDAYADGYLGGSALGRDRDRLYLACALPNHTFVSLRDASTIGPGKHSVQMRGYLPDGTELRTEATEIELGCPVETSMDAGARPRDASVVATDTPPMNTGCTLSGTRGSGPLSWLMLVLTARRRSRRAPGVHKT